jgi:hypothetical protein
MTTLANDTLTHQPGWVIEHIEHLHDNHQLTACDVPAPATRIACRQPWVREGYGVFAGQLRMWRQCAAAENRRMRFLKTLGIGAVCGEPEWTVMLLDAVLIAAPVVAATLVAEHLTDQGRR